MNKNYRLTINRKSNLTVVTSEKARAHTSGGAVTTTAQTANTPTRLTSRLRLIAQAVSLAMVLLGTSSIAAAATLNVTNGNDSGAGSLRDTVAAANSGDIIAIDPSTITLLSDVDAANKSLTLMSSANVTITGGKLTSSGTGSWIIDSGTLTTGTGSGFAGSSGNAGSSGILEAPGGAGGAGGIGVSGTGFTLTNNGNITGGAGGAGGAGGNGEYLFGFGGLGGAAGAGAAAVSGTGFTLTNSGTITGGAGGAGGAGGYGGTLYGIGGPGGTAGAGGAGVSGSGFTLTNSGTITGGAGGVGGSGGFAFLIGPPGNDGAGGVGVISTGNSTIYNSGTISGGTDGGGFQANAIELTGGGNKLVLEAGYVINGNVVSTSAGSDTLALGGSASASFNLGELDTQYLGFNTYRKEDTSTWSLTGTGGSSGDSWTVAAGTLNLNAADGNLTGMNTAADLTGNVSIFNGATVNGFTASITGNVSNAGTLNIGDATSPDSTLTITGNFTNSGTFSPTVADMATYSKLDVSGTATLGGTLAVNVIGTPTLTNGGTLTSVIHAGTVSGAFTTVSDNSLLFDFTPVYTGTDVDLTIASASSTGGATVLASNIANKNKSGYGAARVLDACIANDPKCTNMGGVTSKLGQQSTTQQVSFSTSQVIPTVSFNQFTLSLLSTVSTPNRQIIPGANNGGDIFVGIGMQRGLSAGDAALDDKHLWLRPFGSWANQNNRNGYSGGYDADTYGVSLGVDGELSEASRIGVALTYAHSNVDSNLSYAPQSATINSYLASLYGSHNLDEATTIQYQLGIGKHNNDSRRSILFMNQVASADYSSWSGNAGVRLSRVFSANEKTTFTPSVRADYAVVRADSYSESGAGALNLKVDSDTSRQLVFGVDGSLAHALSDKMTFTASLGGGYDVLNEQTRITAAFAGAPSAAFVTKGIDPSPWLARGGLGLTSKPNERLEISAQYNFEVREDFDNQTASVKARWMF